MKGKALLFGLNYSHCDRGKLNGCINDVNNTASYITRTLGIKVTKVTDDTDLFGTSKLGIIANLYNLALETHRDDLEFVWIHYSGHGSWQRDQRRGDERDGRDECLVPSDYEKNGLLLDDEIQLILRNFNTRTRVFCIFDCCHSGTITDVKYSWDNPSRPRVENIGCRIPCKMITISGCLDTQTSADAWMNGEYAGAMTATVLSILRSNENVKDDVFKFMDLLKRKLADEKFSQRPKLCSTYNLHKHRKLLPT